MYGILMLLGSIYNKLINNYLVLLFLVGNKLFKWTLASSHNILQKYRFTKKKKNVNEGYRITNFFKNI